MKKEYGILFCVIGAAVFSLSWIGWSQEDIIVKGEIIFSKAMVDEDISSISDIVKDGNSRDAGKREPVTATQILSFIRDIDRLGKMPEIEKVTGYSHEWFAIMKKTLESMFKPKAKMETAFLNKDEKAYLEASGEYEKQRRIFLDTLKNPKHVSGKKPKS